MQILPKKNSPKLHLVVDKRPAVSRSLNFKKFRQYLAGEKSPPSKKPCSGSSDGGGSR